MTNHLRIQVQILLTINLKNNINQFYIQCNTKSPLESQCRGNLGFQWGFFTFTHTLNTHFSHILIIGRVYQLIRQITLSVAFPVPNLSVFYISCTLICIISAFMLICGFVQILQFILQKRQLSFSQLSPRVFFQTYAKLQISKMVYKVVIICIQHLFSSPNTNWNNAAIFHYKIILHIRNVIHIHQITLMTVQKTFFIDPFLNFYQFMIKSV